MDEWKKKNLWYIFPGKKKKKSPYRFFDFLMNEWKKKTFLAIKNKK